MVRFDEVSDKTSIRKLMEIYILTLEVSLIERK